VESKDKNNCKETEEGGGGGEKRTKLKIENRKLSVTESRQEKGRKKRKK
jgi:hypothetical protein